MKTAEIPKLERRNEDILLNFITMGQEENFMKQVDQFFNDPDRPRDMEYFDVFFLLANWVLKDEPFE